MLPPLPRVVQATVDACRAAGGRVLLVGGAVRDLALGQPLKDWDLEVHGLDTDALETALSTVGRVDAVGRAFAVLKLHARGVELDLSIPRRDSKVGQGHRGILAKGDPHMGTTEAARRRDLTVNAMMIDLGTGELLDPYHGMVDLQARVLRPVDADTFLEDPLRALRAVQFAARFDFGSTPALDALCAQAAIDELPPERLLGEWAKLLLKGRVPSRGLDLARRTGQLARLFPRHPHPPAVDAALDRAVHIASEISPEPRRLAFLVAVWLARLPAGDALDTLDRLRLHRWAGGPCRDPALAVVAALDLPHTSDTDLRRLSTRAEVDLVLAVRAAVDQLDVASTRERAAALGVLHEAPPPLLLGRHLPSLGMPPGPAMGQVLAAVYAQQLEGRVSTREEALDAARAWLAS